MEQENTGPDAGHGNTEGAHTGGEVGWANEVVQGALLPVGIGLTGLFAVFAAANFWLLEPPANLPMAVSAGLSFLVCLGIVLALRRGIDVRHSHLVAVTGIGIGIANTTLRILLTQDVGYAQLYGVMMIGAALVLLDWRWAAGVVAGALSAWLAVSAQVSPDAIGDSAFSVLTLAALSLAIFVVRSRSQRQLYRLRRKMEASSAALERSERTYRLALAGSQDGLYDWDVIAGTIQVSDRIFRSGVDEALSPSAERLTIRDFTARIHPDDRARVHESATNHLRGLRPTLEDEFRIRRDDGSYLWVMTRGASMRDEAGLVTQVAGSITDMSRRGVFDPLTGLPNRRLLVDRMRRLLETRVRNGGLGTFAVLFVDLDGFKQVNDGIGHQAGDTLLKHVARRLTAAVRACDTVARLGGDEFVIVLTQLDQESSLEVAVDRVVDALSRPYALDDREAHVRASIGVVVDTDPYDDPESLLRDADLAMYGAKASSEPVVFFETEMRHRAAERARRRSELQTALARQEFVVYFQEIMCLESDTVEGYEALARWDSPQRGLVPPGDFIPLMEETGLILELDRWVLRESCRIMVECFPGTAQPGLPYVSVNLSGLHFDGDHLVSDVTEALESSGLDAPRLRLELTESAIIANRERAAEQLEQLKHLGVRMLMDDFGTGHSSLSYLQRLPIDTLKIDRSFVFRMLEHEESGELVRTIIRMAHNLGLDVVAEGIETADQLSALRAMECTRGQGYYFARPRAIASTLGVGQGPRQSSNT